MQTTIRIVSLVFCTLLAFAVSGCMGRVVNSNTTISQAASEKLQDAKSESLIAGDFVNAMRQIPSLVPAATTVQLLRTQTDDELIKAFRHSLEQSGYGVRWVSEPSANNLLQYRREALSVNDASNQVRLDIAIGDVELRRSYTGLTLNQVKPLTPLYVRGADASQVVLDDAYFFVNEGDPSTDTVSLSVPDHINPLSGLVVSTAPDNSMTVNAVLSPNSANVFELGESNYADALSKHNPVVEQVLTFPNDSLRMGETNKQLLDNLVKRFDPATDLLSVVGCSIGPTKLKNGNAALALGRASRVREALLFAGIDQHKILDEGCWAGDSSSTALPRRGVVVTLNRQL